MESRRGAGEKYEMDLNVDAITDEDGKISHYVGVFSDITSRKVTEKELLKLSNTDPLTDLPNRSFFQASHSNIVRRDTQHALICMDMDNFKKDIRRVDNSQRVLLSRIFHPISKVWSAYRL